MRFARGDFVSHQNDRGASYRRYGVLQWPRRLKINFCEIFDVGRFSTFATISAPFGPERPGWRRLFLRVKRTDQLRARTSENDPSRTLVALGQQLACGFEDHCSGSPTSRRMWQ